MNKVLVSVVVVILSSVVSCSSARSQHWEAMREQILQKSGAAYHVERGRLVNSYVATRTSQGDHEWGFGDIEVNGDVLSFTDTRVLFKGEDVVGRYDSYMLSIIDGEAKVVVLEEAGTEFAPSSVPEFIPRQYDKGSLEIVDGIPLLRVAGTPEEMGMQLGVLLKPQIQYLDRYFFPRLIGVHEDRARDIAAQLEGFVPQDYLTEMRALAVGAEVEYEHVLVANVALEVLELQRCSACALVERRSFDGVSILGRNLDFPAQVAAQGVSIVVEYAPHGKKRFLSATLPALVGVPTGINQDGLVAAELEGLPKKLDFEGVPIMFLLRQVLEEYTSVPECIEHVESAERTTSTSYVFADAPGSVVTVEATDDEVALRYPEDEYLITTNQYRSLGSASPGCWRYDSMEQLVNATSTTVGVNEMSKVIDTANQGRATLQSMIFVPSRMEMYVSFFGPPSSSGPYVAITFSEPR